MPELGQPIEIGKGRILKEGSKIAILNYGARMQECLKAAERLDAMGLSTTVADARFCRPLDQDLVRRLATNHEVLISIEEGTIGGFASHVMHFLADSALLENGLRFRPMVIPSNMVDHDKPALQYEKCGLNAPNIVAKALSALGMEQEAATVANAPAE